MPYDIRVDTEDHIIMIRIWDHLTQDEHRVVRDKAAQMSIEHQYHRILVDIRDLKTSRIASTLSFYDFGESLSKGAIPIGTSIAHVMPTDPDSFEDVHFTVTVAKNRGASVGEFASIDEAREWLLSQPDK